MTTIHPHASPFLRILISSGSTLDKLIIKCCAALVAIMLLLVWLGIFSRYGIQLGVTWTEAMARYVMIWAALLAIPVGVFRREHIGFVMLLTKLPAGKQKLLQLVLDSIGLCFFVYLTWYGVLMASQGANQYTTLFGMTMVVPFAAVPVSAFLAAVQTLTAMIRDYTQPQASKERPEDLL